DDASDEVLPKLETSDDDNSDNSDGTAYSDDEYLVLPATKITKPPLGEMRTKTARHVQFANPINDRGLEDRVKTEELSACNDTRRTGKNAVKKANSFSKQQISKRTTNPTI
ncbi:hypothetical protein HK102_006314, partial [Quaeritorhiza haematococci]